ncbi:MAG: hypothetical protein AAB547_00870 [Patescibacteria group bacterium]
MILSPYRKYTPLAALSMLLIAMGGIVWFGMKPLQRSLEEKMRGIQEFYAGRENRERQVGRLPELRGQYDAILENEETLDILITEDRVVDFVKTLEALADGMNVKLSIVSKDNGKITEKKPAVAPVQPQGASADPTAPPVPSVKPKPADILEDAPFDRSLHLSVTVEGRYGDIVAFLRKMETLPIGLDVIGVEMKKIDEQSAERPSARGAGANPFAILGDSRSVTAEPEAAVRGDLEATFDILVYVDKKTAL